MDPKTFAELEQKVLAMIPEVVTTPDDNEVVGWLVIVD